MAFSRTAAAIGCILVMGIAQVVQGMAWVMGPAMVVLCIAALLCVKLVGRGLSSMPHPGDAEAPVS